MTPEEIYLAWAPADSAWSQWVIPVPFAELGESLASLTEDPKRDARLPDKLEFSGKTAYVVDLPSGDALRFGLSLAAIGYRPVPVINGTAGDARLPNNSGTRKELGFSVPRKQSVVDMTDIQRELRRGGSFLSQVSMSPFAPPAFLLDSLRLFGGRPIEPELYDNRWIVFPQDFPSAQFLKDHGIENIVLVQEREGQPQEDLSHTLLRWQEAGLQIVLALPNQLQTHERLVITKPRLYRVLWQRVLSALGLRRNDAGGFGAWPPQYGGGG